MIMPGITYWRYMAPYMVSNKYIIDQCCMCLTFSVQNALLTFTVQKVTFLTFIECSFNI